MGKRITLVAGSRTVSGEVVLEHAQAWQVAVDGKVEVYAKGTWTEQSGGFADIFTMFNSDAEARRESFRDLFR